MPLSRVFGDGTEKSRRDGDEEGEGRETWRRVEIGSHDAGKGRRAAGPAPEGVVDVPGTVEAQAQPDIRLPQQATPWLGRRAATQR